VTALVEERRPPDRGVRYFIRNQNAWSWAALGLGIVTLATMIVGTILVLDAFGWTQFCPEQATASDCTSTEPLAAGLTSSGLGMVLRATFLLTLVTVGVAVVSWFRYQTQAAKEATVAGAVLALQGAMLALALGWFRGSDVPRFARNFLDLELLGSNVGFVWSEISGNFGSILMASIPWAINFAALGLIGWLIWRTATSDHPFAEPVRTMVLAGAAFVVIGLVLDLTGQVTGTLSWLRITDRIGEVEWRYPTGYEVDLPNSLTVPFFGRDIDLPNGIRFDGMLQGIGSIIRFAALWFGFGAAAGMLGRWVLRLRKGSGIAAGPVRAAMWMLVAGYAVGVAKGIVATAPIPSFSRGAWNTLILSVSGAAIGFGGGLLLSLFMMSKRAVIRAPARIYINFFRGTPLIWQISFAGIGLAPALRLDLSVYLIAILVLGFNLAAYSAEVYRAGIQSIERGQMEASRTLGLTYLQSLWYVIVPQAIRRVIPPLLNEFVILIKDTSLVSVLGLVAADKELLGVARQIYSDTFDATAWLGAAAGFLIITLPMIRIVTIVERRMRSGLTSVIG